MAEAIGNPQVVLFREQETAGGARIGFAQLNAERALNALSLDMIRLLDPRLRRWAADPSIACVVLHGAGAKAFCAGGDVRFLRDAILAQHDTAAPNPQAQAFFAEEYRLDFRIHTYPKPILVWGSGIVMGGGLGLLAGASHRVVTETSRIAMPEITIGLYPDVGGSWFLRRMPGRTGLFLGLTGAPLNGSDALEVGLADFFLRSADQQRLFEQLALERWSERSEDNRGVLSGVLRRLAAEATAVRPTSNVQTHAALIQQLTDGDSLAEVVASITGYAGEDTWLEKAAASLAAGSPSSAALVWELWHRARHLSLAEVFRLELIVSLQCCAHPDFAEGVRALLVDKDNQPRWTPPTLAGVTPQWVEEHFAAPWSVWANEAHPLADL
ncbi:MAG TPA: enoyl-CoA hydratase/isomerase family protein [Steroidobacteraceae bacterium]|nr:enoyl-CoA hydratase/isomerase family protein [Steroidobacteraceae bacterium]